MEFETHLRVTEWEEDVLVNLRLLPPDIKDSFGRAIIGTANEDARKPGVVRLFIGNRSPQDGKVYVDCFRIVLTPEEKAKLFSPPKKRRRGPATPQAAPPPSPENS